MIDLMLQLGERALSSGLGEETMRKHLDTAVH